MRHRLLLLFLLIPLLIPTILILYHANHGGQEWRLNVTGFDPRDLLRGRYIQFRYDLGEEKFKDNLDFVCLSGDPKNPIVTKNGSKCIDKIPYDSKFFNSVQRFYIPETIADDADELVRGNMDDIKVGVIIRGNGVVLKNMYFKDRNIIEYLKDTTSE